MADTKKLNKVRGGLLATFTRIHNEVKEFQAGDEMQYSYLLVRQETLEKCYSEFKDVQATIECLGDDTDKMFVDQQSKLRNEVDVAYFEVKVKIKDFGTAFKIEKEETKRESRSSVKLPQISIPEFNGNIENWISFHDMYESLIHKNKDLSDIEKFHYLKSSLKFEASKLIESLSISDLNYALAWDIVKKRYENKKLLIRKHVKSLFNLQAVKKDSSVSLRILIGDVMKNLQILENLGEPVKQWDTLMSHILCSKLDSTTLRDYETKISDDDDVTLDTLIKFLERRCDILESLSSDSNSNNNSNTKSVRAPTSTFISTNVNKCIYCEGTHKFYQCSKFLSLNSYDRNAFVKNKKLCYNCLKADHTSNDCTSSRCTKCSKKHNTLLHFNCDEKSSFKGSAAPSRSCEKASNSNYVDNATSSESTKVANGNDDISALFSYQNRSCHVFLSTAVVNVKGSTGGFHPCRVLLDSGSQSSFITQSFCNTIGAKSKKVNVPISGINQSSTKVTECASIELISRFNSFNSILDCLVVPNITTNLPSVAVDISKWKIPSTINLADPFFNIPNRIDMLLGAEVFYKLLCIGQIQLADDLPMLQNTLFGWVIAGTHSTVNKDFVSVSTTSVCHFNSVEKDELTILNERLTDFWNIEEYINTDQFLSSEEQLCEQHFANNFQRNQTGRFIVRLPFRDNKLKLGESKNIALKRFNTVEKRLEKNEEVKLMYSDFMRVYEDMYHMSEIKSDHKHFGSGVYLPHHCVFKDSSSSTKLRVVFDASAKTDSGYSLNDCLMVGPSIQDDLLSIVMRFRMHNIAICGDIEKMYRQILIHEDDRNFQKILWRPNMNEPVREYELNTVTYGTGPASFLATKCIHQLVDIYGSSYPKAAEVAATDFYVDDILTGGKNVQEVIVLQRQLQDLLQQGCLPLRKWITNNKEVLNEIPEEYRDSKAALIINNEGVKTLGINWIPDTDSFQYIVSDDLNVKSYATKRIILSQISKLFDPLGLLGPVIVVAKILIQELWQLKIDWDDLLPLSINDRWSKYKVNLKNIEDIMIPRRVINFDDATRIEIHGFSDASKAAYGACIYIRSFNSNDEMSSNLLCARSRVAPLKTLTIPRLELCGALLLSRLLRKVKSALKIRIDEIYAYTDSKIVLAWINGDPSRWKIFVSNRIREIQDNVSSNCWYYVATIDNPADVLSRGTDAVKLQNNKLWWHGPEFLSKNLTTSEASESCDLSEEDGDVVKAEIRNQHCALSATVRSSLIGDLCNRKSSFTKIQRILAYCSRFINNSSKKKKITGDLTIVELENSLLLIIRDVQQEEFSEDCKHLKQNIQVRGNSNLLKLNPFLDEQSVLRVGGRLDNSSFAFNKKHPILLPEKSRFTKLLFEFEHKKHFHLGAQALLNSVRDNYWPINGKNLARKIVHDCVRCFKVKPKTQQQLMGQLPIERVTPSRPFTHCGVDFGGPFVIKLSRGRGPPKTMKAYISLFVCFSTRAVHIEVVSDLTSEAFLSGLKRFAARRGVSQTISSDNATNFVGANNELQRIYEILTDKDVKSHLLENKIQWKFIPASSPHFGGIWEAGIKSAKFHLKRVLGISIPTYEELETLVVQIEAILNSRPLTLLTADPNDIRPLTPGHFLIGNPLTSIPEPNYSEIPTNRLSKWQHVQKMYQDFWKRWSVEYVSTMQERLKWRKECEALQINDVVLIKDDNLPPLKWNMGRVIELHHGADNKLRVVTVATANGVFKRAVVKLCKLPSTSSNDNNFEHLELN